jgi:hypothetical protein
MTNCAIRMCTWFTQSARWPVTARMSAANANVGVITLRRAPSTYDRCTFHQPGSKRKTSGRANLSSIR